MLHLPPFAGAVGTADVLRAGDGDSWALGVRVGGSGSNGQADGGDQKLLNFK